MTDTIITVRGEASVEHAPEQATVHLDIAHDGPARDVVFDATSRVAETITTALRGLHDAAAGPVITWSSDRIGIWSDRPWNNEGAQLPLVFHATISVSATFTEFGALAGWVESVGSASGVTIRSVVWELSDATRNDLLLTVRSHAVEDAASKALVYARAAGLTTVRVAAIAEVGLLDAPTTVAAPVGVSRMMMKAGGPTVEFTPAMLEVSARVDGRFLAG